MLYDNLSSVSQNVLKFYQQLTGEERGFEKYWAPVKHVFPDFYLRIGTWVYYVIYVYVFYLYQLGVSY